jgi:large subunit ribosomal protein L30
MIAIIRIHGLIKVKEEVSFTLDRLRLRKKYTCVLIDEKKPELMGMLKKVKDFVAFGQIDEKTLSEMLKARGKIIGDSKGKVKDSEKIAKEIFAGKKFEDLGIKPFFGLHPARGGIDTKHYYPKGALGNHKEDIAKLIMRML